MSPFTLLFRYIMIFWFLRLVTNGSIQSSKSHSRSRFVTSLNDPQCSPTRYHNLFRRISDPLFYNKMSEVPEQHNHIWELIMNILVGSAEALTSALKLIQCFTADFALQEHMANFHPSSSNLKPSWTI